MEINREFLSRPPTVLPASRPAQVLRLHGYSFRAEVHVSGDHVRDLPGDTDPSLAPA
jgi:hypothetical protein